MNRPNPIVPLPLNPLWLPVSWEMITLGSFSHRQAFSYTILSFRTEMACCKEGQGSQEPCTHALFGLVSSREAFGDFVSIFHRY